MQIEFVKNKETKEPFDPKHKVFTRIHEAGALFHATRYAFEE